MNLDKQRAIAFDYLFDAVVVTDMQGIIIDWNKGSELLYGYSKIEAIGQPVSILHVEGDTEHITAEVIAAVAQFGKWSGEVRMLHKDGHIGWIESMCVPMFDENQQMIGALGINRDISVRKQETERLDHLAHYDQLTSIPNRHLLLERVSHLIAQSKRQNLTFSLLFLDLDEFKSFNDSRGHAFGDQILINAASQLNQCIRNSDTLARIGGDEFVLLLEGTSNIKDVSSMAKTLIETLNEGFYIGADKFELNCSIGIASYPVHGETTDALLAAADKAMYLSKKKGAGNFEIFK